MRACPSVSPNVEGIEGGERAAAKDDTGCIVEILSATELLSAV